MPIMPLGKAVVKAAICAAYEDPRFSSVTKDEIKKLEIEVSVLTVPEPVRAAKPEEYLKKIKIGRDGLIIDYMGYSGLLLPQVPVEEKWGVEEFLDCLCQKAGLSPKTWRQKPVSIKAFQAEIIH
jgi:hypothetical protein